MNRSTEHLSRFFEAIAALTFWQRLFAWKRILSLSYPAFEEFKSLAADYARTVEARDEAVRQLSSLKTETENKAAVRAATETELRSTVAQKTAEIGRLNDQLERLRTDRTSLEKEAAALKQEEAARRAGHDKALHTLDTVQARILSERRAEQEEREGKRIQRLQEMKEQWTRHEKDVAQLIRAICRRYSLEYVETVPFKGNPDNTVKICDEFVVFDAKSPGGEDLKNFPQYIKTQAEAVRKYASQEGVRKEIFLVVPQDTINVLPQFIFNMADYTVYAVTPNSLEPILVSLKRLEEYEFVNELSPEERENICRVIGKFAHVVKRRIQVDHFFAWEFLEVLNRCESGLPKELMEKVVEFEKSEKLNPPQERRSKQILTKDLEEDARKVERETATRVVRMPPSVSADPLLPLFEKERS